MQLEFSKAAQRLSIGFEFEIPAWYKQLFYETCLTYYHSCSLEGRVFHKNLSGELIDIISMYFKEHNKTPNFLTPSSSKASENKKIDYTFDDKKVAIAYSGGKDCVYLAIKLIESGIKPENILNIYIPNINKSESHYEKIAVEKTSNFLGCQYHIVETKNSIKVNRSGHNIGTREQLIAGIALPYMIQFGASKLYFGLKKDSGDLLFTDRRDVFDLFEKRIKYDVPQIDLIPYGPLVGLTDLSIAKYMVKNCPGILDLTSSCYTQINFRERRHKALQDKFPNIPLYNGCGSCQKCMIINGAIVIEHNLANPKWVHFYKVKTLDKFNDNKDILQALKEMQS